jgi:hypothetical protein
MTKKFEERFPNMDLATIAAIAEQRIAEREGKNFLMSIKKDAEEEGDRYEYLSRLETKGLEGCEACLTSLNIALDNGESVLGEEETLRGAKLANEQMQIALGAQKIKESISKERGERASFIGMLIGAGVTIVTDLGLKGYLTPITNGAKNAGKRVFDAFKRH